MKITISPTDHFRNMSEQFKKQYGMDIDPDSFNMTADVELNYENGSPYVAHDVKVVALHTNFEQKKN